jgi:3-hydroxyacyl-CoA dehydrogenase
MAIKTVGVVGTGVIGASWTGLFLAHGLRVLVADPSPDAAEKLASYLKSIWPALQDIGLSDGASLDNYQFVGASLGEHYSKVDFIQEVCIPARSFRRQTDTPIERTRKAGAQT